MKKIIANYEAMIKITNCIRSTKNVSDIPYLVVESMIQALDLKGSSFFMYRKKDHELELAASIDLSNEYLNKGPLSSLQSIAASLKDGPVCIYDVRDDPRIQYPKEARTEGIFSILSVPMIVNEDPIGVLRVYTDEPWEATLEDVNFVQAVVQIASMAISLGQVNRGLKNSIEILKANRDPKTITSCRRTLYEGVPISEPVH